MVEREILYPYAHLREAAKEMRERAKEILAEAYDGPFSDSPEIRERGMRLFCELMDRATRFEEMASSALVSPSARLFELFEQEGWPYRGAY